MDSPGSSWRFSVRTRFRGTTSPGSSPTSPSRSAEERESLDAEFVDVMLRF
jgi:hypothetical protein